MADPKGFLSTPRETPARRPVPVRLLDWREVYEPFPAARAERQAGRCMDCGIPFCHNGCPLGNLIPEWNDLVGFGTQFAASSANGVTYPILWLASDEASYVTGTVLMVDGGTP